MIGTISGLTIVADAISTVSSQAVGTDVIGTISGLTIVADTISTVSSEAVGANVIRTVSSLAIRTGVRGVGV